MESVPYSRNCAAEVLLGPEGERIWLLLLDYAAHFARQLGWRTGMVLPEGSSPDAVAKDVIIKVIDGQRTWDSAREPYLLNALKGMVRSDLSHLFSGYEAQNVESIVRALPDGNQRTDESFASSAVTPEQALLKREATQLEFTALELIREEAEGRRDLESVFLALYEADTPRKIAQMTGLPVERIYPLIRELHRIATKISPARVARTMKDKERHAKS